MLTRFLNKCMRGGKEEKCHKKSSCSGNSFNQDEKKEINYLSEITFHFVCTLFFLAAVFEKHDLSVNVDEIGMIVSLKYKKVNIMDLKLFDKKIFTW